MSNKPESQQQPAEESAGDQPRDPIDTIFDAVDSDGSPAPVQESDTLTTDTIDDTDPPVDRVAILGKDGRWLSGWALRFIVLTVAAYFTHIGPNLDWPATYFAGDHAVYRVVATGALAAQP